MIIKRPLVATALLIGLSPLVGCGNGRDDLGRVQGVVTLSGRPLAGVTVVFAKDGAERRSFGETNERGEFSLTTFLPNDGAFLGPNLVTVSQPKAASTESAEASPVSPGAESPPAIAAEPIVPPKYTDFTSTDLRVDVKAGANPIELKLLP